MSTTTHRRVALRRCLASAAAVTIGLGGVLVSTTVANAAPTPSPAVDLDAFTDGRYVVQLVDDGAALYAGGIPNLQRTAPQGTDAIDDSDPAVVAYTDYLEQQQAEVADSVDATVAANLTLTMNGFVADLSAEQAGQLTLDSRVEAVVPDELLQLDLSPANEYLDVEGMWSQVGGVEGAGEGVVVGVLDTGIAPENPLFAGEPLGTTPGELPYLSGSEILFEKGDGETFTGTCETGPQFTAAMCNTKIIGAQYFIDGYGLARIAPAPLEVPSPRDLDGHGSHTASTAAGNHDVSVTTEGGQDIGTMSGVAPEARIAVYKVCWTGNANLPTPAADGCASTDLLQGVEAATADGVDVINFSIGGGAAASVITLLDEQFLGAAAAGVFISASAGNSGPGASTLDHASPWYTTVANTTIENYEATIAFTDPAGARTIPGASITVNMDPAATPLSGEMVYAGDIPLAPATPAQAALCLPNSIDPVQAAGLIVICDRGTNDRVQKSAVVLAAGGIGMIHTNPTPNSVDLDDHSVPTVHVDSQYRAEVLAAADAGSTATFTPGNTSGIVTPAPIVAASSSRGPVLADGGDVIKPDIAAPGTGIIAAGPNAQGEDPSFRFLSGTSMAAPHVAGLAAVYLGANPDATPAEIKSALMTTATDTVNADGSTSQDWFAQGAGFVNTADFLDAGVYYANGTEDWYGYLRGLGYILPDEWVGAEIDPSDLNIPSIGIGALAGAQTITRTLTSLAPGSYDVTIDAPEGIEAVVTPTTLDFTAPGQELSYTVEFTATESSTLGSWASGSLTWDSGDRTARSPIAILPVALDAPEWIEASGTSGTQQIDLLPGVTADIAVGVEGLFPFQTIAEGAGAPGGALLQNDVVVPAGETLHYFTVEANDQAADLDLVVQRLDAAGTAVQQWTSATASADEQVMIQTPAAGTYRVLVDIYSAPTAVTGYTIEHVGVSATGGEGTLTADPSAITATVATPTSYDLSWSDLDRGTRYLGFADYSTADGVRTYVEVDNRPERVWGADRYGVAVSASQLSHPDGADVVYLASGTVFPDGLSAGPAAAAEGAPLLLTQGDTLTASTRAELERLAPTEIVIVGGPATISPAVQSALGGLADTVTRIGGADRYEVSRNIAERAFPEATTAFLATGGTFPDALTAGAAAGSIDAPVVLVHGTRTSIDAATSTLLSDMGVTDVYVTGGPRSVSQGIVTSLGVAGFETTRISGADRFEVGVNLNEIVFTGDAPLYTGEVTAAFVASGFGFPDALSASALAASAGAPLYVAQTTCLPAGVIDGVDALGDPSTYLMGGTATLSPAVRQFTSC